MRHARILAASLIALLLAATLGCGGGGHGYRAEGTPIVIPTAALPATQSGELIDWMIPLEGGCGGPFVITVIDGALPSGVGIDVADGRHHLVGYVLEDGAFDFTLHVQDTGCTPFASTTQAFRWSVSRGPLAIVGSSPGWIPAAQVEDVQRWPDVPALPKTVYGQFTSWQLLVAGGQPPYECVVFDDPNDHDDGNLPVGVVLAPGSCSFVGTPVQVGADGRPFRLTLEVRDSAGANTRTKVQWKIDTPSIVIANEGLNGGRAGSPYADIIQVVDGVPPFAFELLDDVPAVSNEDITWNSPNPPTFPSSSGFGVTATGQASNKIGLGGGSSATYPAAGDSGPNYGPFPSEGIYLQEEGGSAGSFSGIPRRVGQFHVCVHAFSTLVPNERGQHAFRALSMTVAPSDPPAAAGPAFGIDPAFTVEGSLAGTPTLPEFEVGQAYNPDAATHSAPGLQLLAVGGVPADGWTDAPHASQRTLNPSEIAGSYKWSSDWDPDDLGLPDPPAGIAVDGVGLLEVTAPSSLQRTSAKSVLFGVSDYQLPTAQENAAQALMKYSVGPDVVIITHSSSSLSQTVSYYSASQRHDWNDTQVTIQKFQALSQNPGRSPLDTTDMAAGHSVPSAADLEASSNPLGALLSGATDGDSNLDLLRCVVNATGWWDDLHGMNPRGARPFTHADPNRAYSYYGEFGYSYSSMGNFQPSCSAVDLPDAENVSGGHAPQNGIYTDGGRLYHFESATRFGVFVIRRDGRVYVPFAMEKDANIEGFGDGMLESKLSSNSNGIFRTVQMTVSPDGRFAAMKLKQDQEWLYEQADRSRLLIFSLTGEKPFGGETYKIVDTGVADTGTGPRIAYASSMALTDRYLYFLIGTRSPQSTSTSVTPLYYQSWSGHFLMRYEVLSTAPAAQMIPSTDAVWAQGTDVPMQTVFHYHGPHYTTTGPGLIESTTSYGYWPYHRYWQEDGMNFQEHNVAPAPFRVSRNGKAVAFFAGPDYYGTSSTLVYSNYAWVDYDGSGARRITSSPRHHSRGSSRGYAVFHGPSEYGVAWGRYAGPTPGVEISDDGLKVAFVYNTYSGSISASASYSSSSWCLAREDVLLCSTTSGDQWASLASTTQSEVTANTFAGSHIWRFGSLAFTEDHGGLVFWAGGSVYDSTSTTYWYAQSFLLSGTFYHHDVTTTNRVVAMLAASEGGSGDGEGTVYTATSPFNPNATGLNNRLGSIQPIGGFLSRNRKFMYVVSYGALDTSDATACKLVGLNISSVASGNVNGHTNGRGFVPANWPSRRGFLGNYIYYPYYPSYYGYAPDNHQGAGMQVMAKDTGWVFWGATWQYTGPGNYDYYGGPANPTYYYGAYGYGGVGIYGFNADLGGAVSALHHPSLTQDSTGTYELLNFIEVSEDGTRLSYVTTYNYYLFYKHQEYVNQVRNIDFNTPTGAMHGGFNRNNDAGRLESSQGRAGEAMGISAGSNDTYYAFKAGASNETAREMVRARVDPATNQWTTTRFTGVTGRMNVLYATR